MFVERTSIEAEVKSIIAERLGVTADRVEDHQRINEDLGIDSLEMLLIAESIEERFDLEIPDEMLAKSLTVEAIVDSLLQALSLKGEPETVAAAASTGRG